MYFEYTITDEICVDNNDFRQMKNLVRAGKSYEEAFEAVAAGWDDVEYEHRLYVRNAVIAELKRRIAQAEEVGR